MDPVEDAALAFMVLRRLKESVERAEVDLERALVRAHEAGCPKTKVAAAVAAAAKGLYGYDPAKGDGLSPWSVRLVLDSGRHRT